PASVSARAVVRASAATEKTTSSAPAARDTALMTGQSVGALSRGLVVPSAHAALLIAAADAGPATAGAKGAMKPTGMRPAGMPVPLLRALPLACAALVVPYRPLARSTPEAPRSRTTVISSDSHASGSPTATPSVARVTARTRGSFVLLRFPPDEFTPVAVAT